VRGKRGRDIPSKTKLQTCHVYDAVDHAVNVIYAIHGELFGQIVGVNYNAEMYGAGKNATMRKTHSNSSRRCLREIYNRFFNFLEEKTLFNFNLLKFFNYINNMSSFITCLFLFILFLFFLPVLIYTCARLFMYCLE